MSITDIKNNIDDLDKKSKDELIAYIHELLICNKKEESKLLSSQTKIKYLKRNLIKIKNLIEKTVNENTTVIGRWDKDV